MRGSASQQQNRSGNAASDVRRASLVPFILFAGALCLGLSIEASAESARLFGLEGPPCLLGSTFGPAGCPGCGLTRGSAMLLDGRFAEATRLHPAAWCVVLLASLGALLHGSVLLFGRRPAAWGRAIGIGRGLFILSIAGAWIAGLV